MGYTKLFEVIKDETKLTSLITNLSSGCIEIPYIIDETLKILDDNSIWLNAITDSNKRALCVMMDTYLLDCWSHYIADIGLDKLLKYGKVEIYKIEAADGLRYATQGEVANGVKGLIGENIYPAGEENYKRLCLLQWSFTGISYYFRQAGFNLKYDDNGKVVTSFYEMITQSAYALKDLFDWTSVPSNVNDAIEKIKKLQKKKGYKYASYARDEIIEDITIKQLVYNVYKVFPRNSNNTEYRRGLALALKSYKNNKPLTPLEVSQLREIYEKYALDLNKNKVTNKADDELKERCEKILLERYRGKINQNHFAYTIIETLRKINYSKCTNKQLDIINDAYYILFGNESNNNCESDETNQSEIISEDNIDMSLANLSDSLFGMED